MIEPARIQAAIEILEQVASSLSGAGSSADVLIRKYFKTRRYAGSKDRRFVTNLVYQVIRDWGFLSDVSAGDIRKMILLSIGNADQFTGQDHAPELVTEEEQTFLSGSHERLPHQKLNYPLWLEDRLQKRFSADFDAELDSLNGRAPFELRVNVGKTTRAKVEDFL
ncbi:MAG: hypothetical protein JKY45_11730, partial [Emcibacter sp.]|nr:hypothetical protein [Emcibacter sp.]